MGSKTENIFKITQQTGLRDWAPVSIHLIMGVYRKSPYELCLKWEMKLSRPFSTSWKWNVGF